MSYGAMLVMPMLAAAPYAVIETRDIVKTDPNNFQITVRAVDGKAYWGVRQDMKLTPDVHWVVMTAEYSEKNISRRNFEKSLYLAAKPCMRYLVSGQVENSLSADWTIKILGEEKILSCKTKEEQQQEKDEKKAEKARAKQEPPASNNQPLDPVVPKAD